MTSKEKSKYRASKEWKQLRDDILEERGCICAICGKKQTKKNLVLHHIHNDPDNYKTKDHNAFLVICKSEHRYGHILMRKKAEPGSALEKIKDIYEEAGFGGEWRSTYESKL